METRDGSPASAKKTNRNLAEALMAVFFPESHIDRPKRANIDLKESAERVRAGWKKVVSREWCES